MGTIAKWMMVGVLTLLSAQGRAAGTCARTGALAETRGLICSVDEEMAANLGEDYDSRGVEVLTEREDIAAILALTTADGDVVCASIPREKLALRLRRVLREQDIESLPAAARFTEVDQELRSFFPETGAEICESVALEELSAFNRYRHAYVWKAGRRQFLLLFTTTWRAGNEPLKSESTSSRP